MIFTQKHFWEGQTDELFVLCDDYFWLAVNFEYFRKHPTFKKAFDPSDFENDVCICLQPFRNVIGNWLLQEGECHCGWRGSDGGATPHGTDWYLRYGRGLTHTLCTTPATHTASTGSTLSLNLNRIMVLISSCDCSAQHRLSPHLQPHTTYDSFKKYS